MGTRNQRERTISAAPSAARHRSPLGRMYRRHPCCADRSSAASFQARWLVRVEGGSERREGARIALGEEGAQIKAGLDLSCQSSDEKSQRGGE